MWIGGIVDYLISADLLRTTYFIASYLHFQLGTVTVDSQPIIADWHMESIVALLSNSLDVHPVLILLVFDD